MALSIIGARAYHVDVVSLLKALSYLCSIRALKQGFRASVLILASLVAAADSGDFRIEFSTALVHIAPDASSRRRIELPVLEYQFAADTRCPASAAESRLSISIADTLYRFPLEPSEPAGTLNADLTVPAEQLAPLVTEGFCVSDDESSAAPLVVPGALTSHVSLHCGSGPDRTVRFASRPLAVQLVCEPPDQEDSSAESAVSIDR
jgi:hypothetical protein